MELGAGNACCGFVFSSFRRATVLGETNSLISVRVGYFERLRSWIDSSDCSSYTRIASNEFVSSCYYPSLSSDCPRGWGRVVGAVDFVGYAGFDVYPIASRLTSHLPPQYCF